MEATADELLEFAEEVVVKQILVADETHWIIDHKPVGKSLRLGLQEAWTRKKMTEERLRTENQRLEQEIVRLNQVIALAMVDISWRHRILGKDDKPKTDWIRTTQDVVQLLADGKPVEVEYRNVGTWQNFGDQQTAIEAIARWNRLAEEMANETLESKSPEK